MNQRLLEMARDPALIPGVYNHCDQWCTYCPVNERCLAFRRLQESSHSDDLGAEVKTSLEEAITLTREIAMATGMGTPELDALMALGSIDEPDLCPADAALEQLGREYAFQVSRFLASVAWMPPVAPAPRPTPLDVLAWYHVVIATKTFRALIGVAGVDEDPEGADDANGSAKVALIGIDRSRKALQPLAEAGHRAVLVQLRTLLDQLGTALERRFPHARAFIRPGLDEARS